MRQHISCSSFLEHPYQVSCWPRKAAREARLPKEIIQIDDSLPFGGDHVETLVMPEESMKKAASKLFKEDEEMDKVIREAPDFDDANSASRLNHWHTDTLHDVLISQVSPKCSIPDSLFCF